MNTVKIPYESIKESDLYVEAIYCSPRPSKGGYADDVLTIMLHNCRNTGGFRIPHRKDKSIPISVYIYAIMNHHGRIHLIVIQGF